MAGQACDLTDTWCGRFSYPRVYEPVSFTAQLQQVGIRLFGGIEEPPRGHPLLGAILTSRLSGTVSAGSVDFVKTYNGSPQGHHAVRYIGTVADEGLEIHGDWSIPGNWSGTFIMIRSRGLDVTVPKKQMQRV